MTTRIKVAVRIRPFLESEWRNGYSNNTLFPNHQAKQVSVNLDNQSKSFKFDHVFSEEDNQQTVFKECGVEQLVDKAIEGYHSTIFAYGQTGSGKTYTMQGAADSNEKSANEQMEGIIPRTVHALFRKARNKSTERTFTIAVSFLQIYNEKIYDLLNPSSLNPRNVNSGVGGLRMRWSKDEQFTVENLFIFECKTQEEFMQYFNYGLSNRINSCHKLNMSSSRSHSILSLRVESIDNRTPNSVLSSRIELVDLAGSERIGLTGTEGKLAKESIDINKSLFTLRQVISVLSEGPKGSKEVPHIPYRDSKLTSILKQSIGGNSYCLMIACVSPNDSFLEENLSTLAYATKASFIHNKPTINDDPRNKVIGELKREIQALKSELNQANNHIQMMSNVSPTIKDFEMDSVPTDRSQRLLNDCQQTQPVFKRRLTDKIGASQDQFSQRLIESINMVRELLQSNKELREQMEAFQRDNEEKSVAVFQLERQNEQLREKVAEFTASAPTPQPQQQQPSRLKSAKRQASMVDNLVASEVPITYGNNIGPTGKFVDNTFNNFNNYQINQYYISDKAPDSIPTNFNRRQVYSSQEARRRRSSNDHECDSPLERKPMTANSLRGRRNSQQPAKGYGSIYINFKDAF